MTSWCRNVKLFSNVGGGVTDLCPRSPTVYVPAAVACPPKEKFHFWGLFCVILAKDNGCGKMCHSQLIGLNFISVMFLMCCQGS